MSSSPDASTPGLEKRYLRRLHWALRGLPARDRAAIVREIATHIAERSREPDTGVADILSGLGDPFVLAHAYLEDSEPDRPQLGASFHSLSAAMLGGATLGLSRVLARFAAVLFVTCALILIAVAVLKPIAPRSVGLWLGQDHFAFGILAEPGPAATEVLGLWIVPIAVATAFISFRAGTALIKRSRRWPSRRSRAVAFA